MIMFITSIVFASLRLLTIPLAFIGYFALKNAGDPQVVTVPFEIATSTAIAVFGLTANGLMLGRKKIGITLAWVLVASVVASLLVGFWQAPFAVENAKMANPEMGDAVAIGAYVGVGIVSVIRLGLLAAYITALVMYTKWFNQSR